MKIVCHCLAVVVIASGGALGAEAPGSSAADIDKAIDAVAKEAKESTEEVDKKKAEGGFFFPLPLVDSPIGGNAYFGAKTFAAGTFVGLSGAGNDGKAATATLLRFKLASNLQVRFNASLTSAETQASGSSGSSTAPGAATSMQAEIDKFVQAGGNASIAFELPIWFYMRKASKEEGLPTLFSVSALPIINFDLAPLGATSGSALSNAEWGARMFWQRSAIDDVGVAVFAEMWAGAVSGSTAFFSRLGMPTRTAAMYGKLTWGVALLKNYRLTFSKCFMGPNQLTGPWIVSFNLEPRA
jgi:hypothetical protein